MTGDEIRAEIAYIDEIKADYEVAHSRADDLYRAVLREIADMGWHDAYDAPFLAAEALKVEDVKFARYCA